MADESEEMTLMEVHIHDVSILRSLLFTCFEPLLVVGSELRVTELAKILQDLAEVLLVPVVVVK